MKGYIHSLESLGAVDGPGVRYVVFFQGCPLRCAYCHNPDTWEFNAGTEMEDEEILGKMLRNISFYRTGGITATGGEPMMQLDFLISLFAKAKSKGVHTCLDTSGVAFSEANMEKIDRLMEVTDLVMLDIKHINEDEHQKLTGVSGKNILEFAKYLKEKGKKMWLRHVIVPGITLDDEYLAELGAFFKGFDNIEKVEALPYHSLARHKYEAMDMEYPLGDTPDGTKEQAEYAKKIILDNMK